MKLTEKDIEMFAALHNAESGKRFVDYLERLKLDIGFLPENVETAKNTIKVIENDIINQITLQSDKKELEKNEFI